MHVAVVTMWAYADRPISQSPLKQSCERYGVPLVVLQEGEAFVDFYHNKVLRFIDEARRLDFDVLLWVDADDGFVNGDPRRRAVAALEHYETDFLVGAEVNLWPWYNRCYHRFPKVARCNHPNAGVWVATRAALFREYEGMIAYAENDAEGYVEEGRHLKNDDQALFMEWMTCGRSRMTLDTQERLVLNLNALGIPERGFLVDLLDGRLPPVLHGPGQAKALARGLWARRSRLHDLVREPRIEQSEPTLWDLNSTAGLLDMIRQLPPLYRAAEVGCHQGVSTEVLALFTDELLAVDLWPDAAAARRFQERMADYRHVRPVQASSHAAAGAVADRSLDLVYIDADHRYDSVRQDIEAWLPKVRHGGFLTGHDYTAEVPWLEGVRQAVDERFGKPDQVFSDCSWLVQV